MLSYKLVERGFADSSTAPKRYYATHLSKGRKLLKDIAQDMEQKSSLSRGDISNVFENLVNQIPNYLLDGYTIDLGDLGTLRLSLNSEGADTPGSFHVGMIKNIKIIFIPGKMLKEKVAKAQFRKA